MIRRSLGMGKEPLWAHRLSPEDQAALLAVGLIDEKDRRERSRKKLLDAVKGGRGGNSV